MKYWLSIGALLVSMGAHAQCNPLFNTSIGKLNAAGQHNLCELTADKKAVLVVNTASNCGFTPQFTALQNLYQTYKDKGLLIIGFPSDDFFQEEAEAAKTAEVCYINYGVKFPMTQVVHVKGDNAIPLYQQLIEQSGTSPKWNFYKYLVDGEGKVVANWSSFTKPNDKKVISAIEALVQ